MRVKFFNFKNLENAELGINLFLSERSDIEVISISEICASDTYKFIILYKIKNPS